MSLVIIHMLKCWPSLAESELFVKLPSKNIISHPASNKQIKKISPAPAFHIFFCENFWQFCNLAKFKLLMTTWNSSHLWLYFFKLSEKSNYYYDGLY